MNLKELLQNFEELIRGTPKLEQVNCSSIFITLLLQRTFGIRINVMTLYDDMP